MIASLLRASNREIMRTIIYILLRIIIITAKIKFVTMIIIAQIFQETSVYNTSFCILDEKMYILIKYLQYGIF